VPGLLLDECSGAAWPRFDRWLASHDSGRRSDGV